MNPLLAPALCEGDTVALIAPAGPVSAEEISRAQEVVRKLGLLPQLGANAAQKRGYLAGNDADRAADFNAAARDKNVRGIFALRGGYGTMRILDAIDYAALQADPKVLLGYSDLTAPLNAVAQRTGLVTFHGPVAALSEFTEDEVRWLKAAITNSQPMGELRDDSARTLTGGTAEGRIVGGNLSLIVALEGTPYAIDTNGAILLIEEVEEAPYRIDRMLTQLRLSGALQRCAGIIGGGWTNCDVAEDHIYAGMRLQDVLHDRLADLGIPVLLDVPSGHIDQQWTLPIGVGATLDAGARTLMIAESSTCEPNAAS